MMKQNECEFISQSWIFCVRDLPFPVLRDETEVLELLVPSRRNSKKKNVQFSVKSSSCKGMQIKKKIQPATMSEWDRCIFFHFIIVIILIHTDVGGLLLVYICMWKMGMKTCWIFFFYIPAHSTHCWRFFFICNCNSLCFCCFFHVPSLINHIYDKCNKQVIYLLKNRLVPMETDKDKKWIL